MNTQTGNDGIAMLLLLVKRMRAFAFTIMMRGRFRSFGQGSRVEPPFRFAGLRDVVIDSHVYIGQNCWINVIGPVNPDGSHKLTIGAGSGIGMGSTISSACSIKLGNRVLLARNVYISDHGHQYLGIDCPIVDQGITEPRAVVIGDDTWLGQNACVLPGVRIGRHCVVGANAVVTKDVPDFSVVAGVPALVIRYYDVNLKKWVAQTHTA